MAPPSSSESWSAELFPKSHPRHNKNCGGGGASISGASMSHPHIRELVERQQQIKQLQRQLDNTTTNNTSNTQHHQLEGGNNIKELYYSGKSNNVIQGLHMNHVLNTNGDNNSMLEDGTSLLQSVPSQSHYYSNNHPLSPHLNHSLNGPPHSSANPIHRNNIHRNTQHSNTNTMNNNNNNNGYEIEGTFQSKGCIPQTADDVGYLFGCGTYPHDEVVYVYNTVPTTQQQQQPITAMADERNLFYHTGPTTNTNQGGGGNVNDVLFQIDKEYQQLQSNHVENMREPPPRYPPGHYKMQQQQQHQHHGVGNNMREQDDDEYTKRSGCSISSIMDLLLPNLRHNKASRTMRDSNSGYYGDYPTDNWRTLCTSPKRKRRGKHHTLHNVVSTSSSEDSTFERTKRRAKDSVYELQQQLKAMVHDRAKSKVGTPKKEEEESRQESTPPVSPKPTTEDKQKDIDQLRQEQATLDQARKLLQVELAQHQQVQLATLNATTNPYYNGSLFGIAPQGMISPLSAPIASGVGCASGGMMSSPMMMNTGGMLQPQLSHGMWPQQQQQGLIGGGIMGMQQTGMHMMQNTQVGGVVPQQIPSNVSELSKSIFTGAPQQQGTTQGKFIDNVGAGLGMSRSYSVHPTRTTQSKKKLSPPHPTRSYSNNEFTSQSNQRLNDLKSKNESIRKDISRMKEYMNTGSSPSRRKGGQRGDRPFPRTSPPSSPTRQDRDDAIARAMQRSDEARSLLSGSSNGSMGYISSPNRHNRGSSRRQPPSPIRTSSRRNQEYYHV